MGEIADSMLDGEMCSCCGVWMEDFLEGEEPTGYPRLCADCENNHRKRPNKKRKLK